MTEQETLEEIVKRFEAEGLNAVMTTPPKTMRFAGSPSTRQSPRHRGDQPNMETRRKALVMLTAMYISPRAVGAPDIQLAKHSKYPIPLSSMSKDVIEEGALLGHIPNLKYQDYNLLDPEKFPQFQANRYMCRRTDPVTNVETLALQEWIEKLALSGLLNLLHILHFTRNPELNVGVKVLLSCVHNGYLWLDLKIDVNMDIIHRITGLSKVGMDLASHFVNKNLDRKLSAKLTKEFNLTKGG